MDNMLSPQKHALLVEDESFYQDYFKGVMARLGPEWSLHIVGSGAEATEFLSNSGVPLSLLLVDIGLPDVSGLEVIRQAYQRDSRIPIIVTTVFSNEENFVAAIRAGASGYLLKAEPEQALATALQQVLEGNFPVSPSLALHLFRLSGSPVFKANDVQHQISTREIELLGLLAQGLSYSLCAETMGISLNTVQSHVRNVYRKLNVSNQTQAINKARSVGVIS